MLDEYIDEQSNFYNVITKSIFNNKISHAYLIESNGYAKVNELVFALAKLLYCPNHYSNSNNCFNCSDCQLIMDNNINNIRVIKTDGLWIKKEQLLDLQNEFLAKSLNNRPKIYIIEEAEKLNKSSANTILKFLEEPSENIIAILITSNKHNVIETIVSRCITFSLDVVKDNVDIRFDDKLVEFVNCLENQGKEFIANYCEFINFKKIDKDYINVLFQNLNSIYTYLFELKKNETKSDNDLLNNILEKNNIMTITNKLKVINHQFIRIKANNNLNLLMDKFIIDFSREVN